MRYLLIDGHPDANRLTAKLLDVYSANCPQNAEIDRIALRDLQFDPVLHNGYAKPQKWEPDLENAARLVDACDHLVFAFPMWWGGEPALVKGFVDRVFLPHFAFRYHDHDDMWDGLMEGRSADTLVTMDTPRFFLTLVYRNAIVHRWRKQVIGFCGFQPNRFHIFSPVRKGSAEKKMNKWQNRIAKAAQSSTSLKRKARISMLQDFLDYGSKREESP